MTRIHMTDWARQRAIAEEAAPKKVTGVLFWQQRDGVHVAVKDSCNTVRKVAVWPARVEVRHG